VSFGEATGRDTGVSKKKPKPKKGEPPATLEEVPLGETVTVKMRVKLFRWSKGSCHVRPLDSEGKERGPEIWPGDVEVVG
jgi:hypothetical protein